jgi:HAD superfamily hydrolase (TIGR01509 family)
MIKGIIFDCDGVLVDSEKLSCGVWVPVLARHGITTDLDEIEQFIGRSDAALLDYFSQRDGVELPSGPVIAEREAAYFEAAAGNLHSFAGLVSAINTLRSRGLPLAVASSGGPKKIAFNLKQAGLDGLFEAVCSAVEVRRGKPAPDLFLLAAERLGLPAASCCVIEDSVPGLEGAVAAGMYPLGFSSSHAPTLLFQAGARQVFSAYDQLDRLI